MVGLWYPDVGGDNAEPCPLAIIPLRWMIEQIVQSNVQILFDYDEFTRWDIPTSIGQDPPPQRGGKFTEDDADVAALDALDADLPIFDHLRTRPLWWIFEIIPLLYTYQNAEGKWITTFRYFIAVIREVDHNQKLLTDHILDADGIFRKTLHSTRPSRYAWTIPSSGIDRERVMRRVPKSMCFELHKGEEHWRL